MTDSYIFQINCFKLAKNFQPGKIFSWLLLKHFPLFDYFQHQLATGLRCFAEDLSLFFCEHFVFISLTFQRPVEHFNCEIFCEIIRVWMLDEQNNRQQS